MPKLMHPDTKHRIDVTPEQAPLYATQGWVPVPPRAKKTPAPTKDAK